MPSLCVWSAQPHHFFSSSRLGFRSPAGDKSWCSILKSQCSIKGHVWRKGSWRFNREGAPHKNQGDDLDGSALACIWISLEWEILIDADESHLRMWSPWEEFVVPDLLGLVLDQCYSGHHIEHVIWKESLQMKSSLCLSLAGDMCSAMLVETGGNVIYPIYSLDSNL